MMYEPFALSLSKGFDKLSPNGIVPSQGRIYKLPFFTLL